MPFKFYHGRTGKIFNVNRTSLGVVVNKLVGNRIIPKRIHVRPEHIRPSKCREAFVGRIQECDRLKTEANKVLNKIYFNFLI
jgi:large subunit ribosomal protein L21e